MAGKRGEKICQHKILRDSTTWWLQLLPKSLREPKYTAGWVITFLSRARDKSANARTSASLACDWLTPKGWLSTTFWAAAAASLVAAFADLTESTESACWWNNFAYVSPSPSNTYMAIHRYKWKSLRKSTQNVHMVKHRLCIWQQETSSPVSSALTYWTSPKIHQNFRLCMLMFA